MGDQDQAASHSSSASPLPAGSRYRDNRSFYKRRGAANGPCPCGSKNADGTRKKFKKCCQRKRPVTAKDILDRA